MYLSYVDTVLLLIACITEYISTLISKMQHYIFIYI
jgi:hypothetical protein